MIWQNIPYTYFLTAVLAYLIINLFFIYKAKRDKKTNIIGLVVAISSIIWILSCLFELGLVSFQAKLFFTKMQYIGSSVLPVGLFFYIAKCANLEKWIKVRNIILLSILPAVTLILVYTNDFHNLVWKNIKLIEYRSFLVLLKDFGIWPPIYISYSYILILIGAAIIIKVLFRSPAYYKMQIILLIAYISLPLLVNIIKVFDIDLFPYLNMSTVAFAGISPGVVAILANTKKELVMPVAYNHIFDSMDDGVMVLDQKNHILGANQAFSKIFSVDRYNIVGDALKDLLPDLDKKIVGYNGSSKKAGEIVIKSNGDSYTYGLHLSYIKGRESALGKVAVLIDITKRKEAQDGIKYLYFHDKLTGLYNRAFFDEQVKRLDTDRNLPLSIIMGDLNGLKLINDTFGLARGDRLLQDIAKILKDSLRKDSIIARFGGDEFIVLLPKVSHRDSLKIIDRIKENCRNNNTMPVSFSLGVSTKNGISKNISEVIKEAEDRMYRNKMVEAKSIHSHFIKSLIKTMEERDYDTKEHIERIKKDAIKLGRALNLPDDKINELSLLATLHDIGKLSVADNIFLKPGKLTLEEREEIEKHPEVGCKIASSSPEISSIANGILYHHEWWNGKGYPEGLVGSKIPIVSRIISVVDAYDAMTNHRPYRKARSKKQALKELKRFSGTQFDPELADVFIGLIKSEFDDLS